MGAGHTRQISGLSTLFHCESRTTLKKKKEVCSNKQTNQKPVSPPQLQKVLYCLSNVTKIGSP